MMRFFFLFLLFVTATATTHVIPIVPHHVVQQRRRRLTTSSSNNTTQRPHRYPRWLQQQQQQQPSKEQQQQQQQIAGLFQGYGTHYADLWVGTPPQRQTVIVDTGSGITAFPCQQCHNQCGVPDYHLDALFDETASSTFVPLQCGQCLHGTCDHNHNNNNNNNNMCQMGQSYQEGSSWHAQEVMDTVYVGGLHTQPLTTTTTTTINDGLDPFQAPHFQFNMKFGCQTSITGLFITQLADGIMGMDKAKGSYWKQMIDNSNNIIQHAAFALCFSRSPTASRQGTSAGAMTLGGTDTRLHQTTMVYTDQTGSSTSTGFYQVYIRKAYLQKGTLLRVMSLSEQELNQGNVIVDSGTTDTYFHHNFGKQFYPLFQEMMSGRKFDHKGQKMTAAQIDEFPTILLQLSGDVVRNQAVVSTTTKNLAGDLDPEHPYDVLLAIPPSHYFEYDGEDDKYYARFYADEKRGSVLGANAMMGHDVLFDIDNGVLGWAESDCDYNKLVEMYHSSVPDKREDQKKGNDEKKDTNNHEKEDIMNNDEERFKPEDPATTRLPQPVEYCTSKTCQISVTVLLVGAVILVGYVLAQRTTVDELEGEELTAAELEMQSPPSSHYRDDDDDDDDDDDEMPSMRLT